LKLDFSHAKELLHYKYRSQCMQKGKRESKKKKPQEKAITRNPTKKINKKKTFTKKKGRDRILD